MNHSFEEPNDSIHKSTDLEPYKTYHSNQLNHQLIQGNLNRLTWDLLQTEQKVCSLFSFFFVPNIKVLEFDSILAEDMIINHI